jgi:hypothetical protein
VRVYHGGALTDLQGLLKYCLGSYALVVVNTLRYAETVASFVDLNMYFSLENFQFDFVGAGMQRVQVNNPYE